MKHLYTEHLYTKHPYTKHLHTALIAGVLAAGTSFAASAETLEKPYDPPYDPVARAIALGLTPDMVDAAFDRALAAAESCDAVAMAMQAIGCAARDVATLDLPTVPPLES